MKSVGQDNSVTVVSNIVLLIQINVYLSNAKNADKYNATGSPDFQNVQYYNINLKR